MPTARRTGARRRLRFRGMATGDSSISSYGQLCPVALGTDAVGDRWTLLLLRDLAHGPLRFGELAASNPGISPTVLAARLARLEESGLVEVTESGSAGHKRYRLAGDTRGPLLRVLTAVAGLGRALAPAGSITADLLVAELASDRPWFLAKHHRTDGTFCLRIDDVVVGLKVDQHTFEPTTGAPDDPSATVTTSFATMQEMTTAGLTPQVALDDGRMQVEGDVDAVVALFTALAAGYVTSDR